MIKARLGRFDRLTDEFERFGELVVRFDVRLDRGEAGKDSSRILQLSFSSPLTQIIDCEIFTAGETPNQDLPAGQQKDFGRCAMSRGETVYFGRGLGVEHK